MISINERLLVECGLGGLRQSIANLALRTIYDTLEARVGRRLANLMSQGQMDEFEAYFNAKDDPGAFAWLASNFPNYKGIVADEYKQLCDEVKLESTAILISLRDFQVSFSKNLLA